jgi:high-affinity Fe2+/Pb2+ permease
LAASRTTLLKSIGALVQTLALVGLVGLVPYTLFAAYGLYVALSSTNGSAAGPLVYSTARFAACMLLFYSLWRLRQAGMRWRNGNAQGR